MRGIAIGITLVTALTAACSATETPPEAVTDASEEPAAEHPFSEDAIQAALERGTAQQHEDYLPTCDAHVERTDTISDGVYHVIAYTPLEPVAAYAAEMSRLYMPMPTPDSPEVMALLLSASFFRLSVGGWMVPEYDNPHVVMRPAGTDRDAVVQPLSSQDMAGVVEHTEFDPEDVLGIARQADAEVVIVTAFGEYSCTLSAESILLGYGEL